MCLPDTLSPMASPQALAARKRAILCESERERQRNDVRDDVMKRSSGVVSLRERRALASLDPEASLVAAARRAAYAASAAAHMVDVRLGVSTKIASEPEAQLHAALERYDSKSSSNSGAVRAAPHSRRIGAILRNSSQLRNYAQRGVLSILRYPTSTSTPPSARGAGGSREAARRGLTKPAQELLERGAEVDAPDECGDAALRARR